MQPWFVLTLISVFIFALAEINQKRTLTSKLEVSVIGNNFVIAIFQLIFSIIFCLISGISGIVELSPQFILLLVFSGFFSFIANSLYYHSFKGNSVSLSTILYNFTIIITTISGVFIFQEQLYFNKVLGIGLIIFAVILISYKKGEKLDRFSLFALASTIFYAIANILDKTLTLNVNPHVYQVYSTLIFMLFTILLRPKVLNSDLKKMNFSFIKTLILTSLLYTIFNKLMFMAYSMNGEIGKIGAIQNSAVFIVILFEVLILKDRSKLRLKLIAGILAVIGILILS